MNGSLAQREGGQTLVYVTISLVLVLLIAVIAIDAGHLYSERRRMQNAADAGALAGARELCLGNGQTAAQAKGVEYAVTQNPGPYGHTATASADMTTYIVTVATSEQPGLFLAGALGLAPATVGATAKAACGAATTTCGLWPIGFPQSLWNQMGGACGRTFYVWMDDTDDTKGNPANQLDCSKCDCDLDKSQPGPEVVSDQGRAWLDFSDAVNPLYPGCAAPGCGASELKCWITSGSPAPITIPACTPGDNGEKQGTRKAVQSRVGDIVKVPLFDGTGCGGTSSCPGGQTYHLNGFGCIKVIDWGKNTQLYYPPPNNKVKCWKGDLIEVQVSCDAACLTSCGTTGGGGPPPAGSVWAVSLVP